MIKKTVQRSDDLFVQFTDEELSQLGIKQGDKFSCTVENGEIKLTKFATIDIDLSELNRELLEFLIIESCDKDISINEVISNFLEKQLSDTADV